MASERSSVLLIEDDTTMARVYAEYLDGEGYELTHVTTGRAAMEVFDACVPDLALVDLKLPDMDGFDILRAISERQLPTEAVVITGQGSMNVAIQAMQLGARDFLVKPFSKERLITILRNTLERQKLTRIVETYREEIDRQGCGDFIGSSLAMQGIYRIIDSAAGSKATVFITGESGTGKEVCAEAIHKRGDRRDKPFIAINCVAIPKDLIESEIFGHVKGAFTGAIGNRDGAAKQADGGTLFLDEICEMELNLQPKLLRFLQTGTFQKVGDSRTTSVDVRIICATNRVPMEEVKAGRFREDLYYRLHVLPIHLPPLCDREGDVIEIARHFLAEYTKEEGKGFERFAPETEMVFQAFDWPGNVRQLQNIVRNIIVLNSGDVVTPDMLPAPLDRIEIGGAGRQVLTSAAPTRVPEVPKPVEATVSNDPVAAIRSIAELEREAIEKAIEACDGNVPEAAHYLGISAATIYRKKAGW